MSVIGRKLFFCLFGCGQPFGEFPFSLTPKGDLEILLSLARFVKPSNVLELGVQLGFTAKFLLRECDFIRSYVGIDVPPDFHPTLPFQRGEVPTNAGEEAKDDKRFRVCVTPNGSVDFEKPGNSLDGNRFQFVFIDADHSYEGVKRDTRIAQSLLSGGVLVWHDYGTEPGVTQFIDEENQANGNKIVLVESSNVCFQFIISPNRRDVMSFSEPQDRNSIIKGNDDGLYDQSCGFTMEGPSCRNSWMGNTLFTKKSLGDFVIKVKYGGLGDHLFYSHLPRIAKKQGFARVLVSRRSDCRNPEYLKYIWEMNPYVDGFTDEDAPYPEGFTIPESMNLLDMIMLERGLDDGERWHEPEFYFKPDIDGSLEDLIVFDPNFISNAGEINTESLRLLLNELGVLAVMARRDRGFDVKLGREISTEGSFKRYCEVIASCRQFVCLVSGGATLSAALGKPATVIHGHGVGPMFLHSRRNQYIDFSKWDCSAKAPKEDSCFVRSKSLSVLVFSADRPLFLKTCLESLEASSFAVTVFYLATNDAYTKAYAELVTKFPAIKFVRQDAPGDIKPFMRTWLATASDILMVTVDDNIFNGKIDIETIKKTMADSEIFGFTLRLSPGILRTQDGRTSPSGPEPKGGVIIFEPARYQCPWDYVWEISSTFYRKADLERVVESAGIANPNDLECAGLKLFSAKTAKKMACFGLAPATNVFVDSWLSPQCVTSPVSNETALRLYNEGREIDLPRTFHERDLEGITHVKRLFLKPKKLTNSAIVVIPSRNAEKWTQMCVQSVLGQTYQDIGIVFIDDNSTDNTHGIATSLLSGKKDVVVISRVERHYATANIDFAVRECCSNPNAVMFLLDGDDWLTSPDAIEKMMREHENADVVWSQHVTVSGKIGLSGVLQEGEIRQVPWVTSHLRSFKKFLYDSIRREDLLGEDGKPYRMAYDQAIMLPMLEMVPENRRRFLPEILYVYNDENPQNDFRIDWREQQRMTDRIRAGKRYSLHSRYTSPLKIAYVLPNFTFGGAEMNAYRLGKEAKSRNWQVGFFAIATRSPSYNLSWADEVFSQPEEQTWAAVGSEMLKRLNSYDIIHMANQTQHQRIQIKSLSGKRFFETWHGIQSVGWAWPIGGKVPTDGANARFAVTNELVEAIRQKCGGESVLSLNPVPVPSEVARLDGQTIVMVGRLDGEKNQLEFVEILGKLKGAKGVLVGDADKGCEQYRKQIEDRATQLGADLTITGYVQDSLPFVLSADVLLHTSSMENQPIAILEAMAAGVPVVARSVGGIPSLINHEEDGFLYSNIDSACGLVSRLLQDKVLAREIGLKARKRVTEKHGISACFDFHEPYYRGKIPVGKINHSVSVIISSYNQIESLKLALESLYLQVEPPHEVIVTDDGSSDGTIDWLDSVADKYPFPLNYVTRQHSGYRLASLQNLGARKATGDRFLFTNADVVHCPTSIRGHAILTNDTVGAGIIKSISEEGTAKVTASCVLNYSLLKKLAEEHPHNRTNICYGKYDLNSNPIAVWGGNFSVSSVAFRKSGGFDEGFDIGWGGEDASLAKRCKEKAGCTIVWVDQSVVYHLGHPWKAYNHQQKGATRYAVMAG